MKQNYLHIIILAVVNFIFTTANAQNDFLNEIIKDYQEFRDKATSDYNDFRDKALHQYIEFAKQPWQKFEANPVIPIPKEKPPVIIPTEPDDIKPLDDKVIDYDKIVPSPEPNPQPKPIFPIDETPDIVNDYFTFYFLGTKCTIRLDKSLNFKLNNCSEQNIADGIRIISNQTIDNTIADCINLRTQLQLCDWAYLQLLYTLSQEFFGKGTNEATLLMAYLYSQSGYKMRLASANQKSTLVMLYASKNLIFNQLYYTINGEKFYLFEHKHSSINICQASFPNEKSMSLEINYLPKLEKSITQCRLIQSRYNPNVSITVCSNENMINFFKTYPSSQLGNDFMTQWAIYANTPLDNATKDSVYPQIKALIKSKSELEATNIILNLLQTGLVYKRDDEVWGMENPLFAEETLFYPYCDCEDRAILFSRFVRDILGLKTILVYYPGHLASAVCFTEPTNGDYLILNDEKYVICDPTITGAGAPVGTTMSGMDNSTAAVILLR